MNLTKFIVYKNQLNQNMEIENQQFINIQECPISKNLYISNCDKKVIGNLSSIYQTIISLFNLKANNFYYENEMLNLFILKMENTL